MDDDWVKLQGNFAILSLLIYLPKTAIMLLLLEQGH